MALSLHTGEGVMLNQVGGFADCVAVKTVGEETFRMCRELVDGVVVVSRDAICASIKVGPMNITEFKYRFNSIKEEALVLYSVGLHTASELAAMKLLMEYAKLRTLDLTKNYLVKDHLRHLIKSGLTSTPRSCRVVFGFIKRRKKVTQVPDSYSSLNLFSFLESDKICQTVRT